MAPKPPLDHLPKFNPTPPTNTPDPKYKKTKTGRSSVVVTLGVEMLAVGMFALIADTNDQVGNIVILFMVGLWLIYAVTDSAVIASIGSALSGIATSASKS